MEEEGDDIDDVDGDDEPDKIPTHHLGFCLLRFCPLGFILHTMMSSLIIDDDDDDVPPHS